jgi:hypothetical protein
MTYVLLFDIRILGDVGRVSRLELDGFRIDFELGLDKCGGSIC